ncbi:sensor histidine kinase [Spirosoma flavum]|uniref:histidine kinase n=1 Tax=Spirosoma flavum TaxID=2048557 RepID=A0ABW6AJM6_9BACT
MTIPTLDAAGPMAPLAAYLSSRREAMLAIWRTTCESDPNLNSAAGLTREEFNNRVPFMLNELEHRLGGRAGRPEEAKVSLLAAEHGLHRWQKGYTLHELSAEMQHLNNSLLAELRLYWEVYSSIGREVMTTAYEYIATFSNQISVGSVEQYAILQRTVASSRVDVLEQTLAHLNQVSQQRSNLLHQSSHDLRGSFGIIQGAASLLELTSDSEEDRKRFLEMLQRNLANSRHLVAQLIDLARLDAGQEPLHIQTFNAGQLVASLVADYQPLAQEQGLVLKADGPDPLSVEGDPLQLQRIIQNLVLNALKHTANGFVSVSWSRENDYRWTLSVQDSGPGLPTATTTGSLPQVLSPSPESTAAFGLPNPDAREAIIIQATGSTFANKGEGIGLSIVKGLCELLRASLEIESRPGMGTLFRIRLPIHWHP